MLLEWQYLDGAAEDGTLEFPSRADVEAKLDSLDWQRFSSIQLTKDVNNWLNGSGIHDKKTGLAMMLSIDGIQHVSETAPNSPAVMLPVLLQYLEGNLNEVLRLIYDADERELTDQDIEQICLMEETNQNRK